LPKYTRVENLHHFRCSDEGLERQQLIADSSQSRFFKILFNDFESCVAVEHSLLLAGLEHTKAVGSFALLLLSKEGIILLV